MSEAERVILLCCRVADATASTVVHGSTQEACSVCAAAVWVSPTSRGIRAREPSETRLMCAQCMIDGLAHGASVVMAPPTPAQRAEILAHFARN